MFVATFVLAAIELAVACACFAMARSNWQGGYFVACLIGVLGGWISFCVLMSPPLLLQFVVLLVLGLSFQAIGLKPRTFLLTGTCLTLAILAAGGALWMGTWDDLKQRYPMESLADRLAYETRQPSSAAVRPADDNDGPPPNKLSNAALRESLTKIDELYEKSVWAYSGRRRTEALSLIHASQVTHFINSPGFGVGRGGGPAYWTLYQDQRQLPLPMPSGESATKPDASAEDFATRRDDPAQSPVPGEIAARLESLHGEAQVDFADPKGFGYVKDREHVVGFQSHHFRHPLFIPPAEKLGIRKVELVSLLKHEKPMVYLSKNLPQMDELKNAPVRPLDAFEEQSLPALRDGGNLETRADGNRIRMLGAIRAARQCLNCHAVEHGTLLGAFSYELTSEGTSPVRPAAVKPDPVKPAL